MLMKRTILHRLGLAVLLVMALGGFRSGEGIFAPDPEPWQRWEKYNSADTRTIDHGSWTEILKKYVLPRSGQVNTFAYDRVDEKDRDKLANYITELSALSIGTYNRPEQMAYWINLYNALTISIVLEHYPVQTIRDIDISPGLFSDGPWGKQVVEVEGEALSLNDIEHRILRVIWPTPLVHYGVNCASIGCPDLGTEAFTGTMVNAQLEVAARAYVNDSRGVSIKDGKITVSKIYDWFIDDFGGNEAGVIQHLLAYATPELAKEISSIGTLSDVAYDWALNGTGKQP